MIINRNDGDRDLNREVERIIITVDDHDYTLTHEFDDLVLMANGGERLFVSPSCSNVIRIRTEGW